MAEIAVTFLLGLVGFIAGLMECIEKQTDARTRPFIKRLTPQGWCALIVIAALTFMSAILSYTGSNAAKRNQEQLADSLSMARMEVSQLRTSLNSYSKPLWPMIINALVAVPLSDSALSEYHSRLRQGAQEYLIHYDAACRPMSRYLYNGMSWHDRSQTGDVTQINITHKCPLIPDIAIDPVAYGVLYHYSLRIAIVINQHSDAAQMLDASTSDEDLVVVASGDDRIVYDIQRGICYLDTIESIIDQSTVITNHHITGLPDLENAEVHVCFYGGISISDDVNPKVNNLRNNSRLEHFQLKAGGRILINYDDKPIRCEIHDGQNYWVYKILDIL